MNKKLIFSMIAGAAVAIPGLAQAQSYDVRACLPVATGFDFDSGAAGTTLDFGTLEQDATFGFFSPVAGVGPNGDGVLKVYVGATGGTGAPGSIDIAFTDGNNPNDAAGVTRPGIGGKASAFLTGLDIGADAVDPSDDQEFAIAAAGGSTAANATLHRLDTNPSLPMGLVVEGGVMLSAIVNFGLATGDPTTVFAGTPAEPFTGGDVPGEYTGTVTLTATPNSSLPGC